MFLGAKSTPLDSVPVEETSTLLSATQREMYAYKRLQTELGMASSRIAEGIEAIVRGKTEQAMPSPRPLATSRDMDERFDSARGDEAKYDKDT